MTAARASRLLKVTVLGAAIGALIAGQGLGAAAQAVDATTLDKGAAESVSTYYLALGDSASVGIQPNKGETDKGYVDVLARRVREHLPSLRLRNVGCAGETSRSMITGINSPCRYHAGSQLQAAVAFLEAHPGQVVFVTVNIGVNDFVMRCLDGRTGLIERECAVEQGPRLQARVEAIVTALRAAAGSRVPILGMNYYNPLLGFWGLVPGGRAIARTDQRAWVVFNSGLSTAYEGAGATSVDVASTFRIDDFENTVVVPDRGELPVNVATACEWTWFCSSRFFGDPHANNIGYRKIARTFYEVLSDLACLDDIRSLGS